MKKVLMAFMAVLLTIVLVGCGSSSNSSSSSSDSSSSDSAEMDMASMVDDVKTKIKDGADDVKKDVQDALDTDSDIVGTWKATNADVSDTQKGDITLELNEDETYTEDVSYVDANGAVVDAANPNETFNGVYLVKDNSIAILPEEGTVDGQNLTGDKLYDPVDYGRTYDYKLDGDKLTLTDPETNLVIEFTKGA